MIQLTVDKKCHECLYFEPETKSSQIPRGAIGKGRFCLHLIDCKHRDICPILAESNDLRKKIEEVHKGT